jgi:glycosyltransferase involved in cell wall biosynthesis
VAYTWKILKVMLTFRPSLVYFTLMPTGFAFYRDAFYMFLLKCFRAEIVLHLHGKGIHKTVMNSRWKRRIYYMVFRNTHVICLSKTLSNDVNEIYKTEPFIVPNGIQVHPNMWVEYNRDKRRVPQLLFLSNYIENKGILVLIEAMVMLKEKGYRFNTRFVGAPTNLSIENLTNIIDENGLKGYADVVGPLYDEAKYTEFRNADIFVFPTYNDAFPLVNLEAMQFSLPIVTTYEGGNPDIVVNNETGFLVETRNPQKLAEKIAILLDNEALRVEMGQKGYDRFINNFTLQHFEINLKDTLTNILTAC